jgi:ABC-2 type transport system permease protein
MNTESNVMPQSIDLPGIPPAAMAAPRPFYWSLRREFWENRWIYIAPLVVAGVFLFGFLISTGNLPNTMHTLSALNPTQQHKNIQEPYDFAAGLLMATQLLVGVFYCLEMLHGERRDRSILFWKSLPVSDATTVVSKATVPLVILPLLTWAITVVTHLTMLLLSTAVAASLGLSVAALWAQLSLFGMWLGLLYHLVTVHSLWHAPFYGWLLLVSGWARKAPFLWAVLPVLAIIAVEKIVFNTSYFAAMLGSRFAGGPEAMPMRGSLPIYPGMQLATGRFLGSPGLWIGLIVTVLFLGAAVRLRRYRGPI